MDTQEEQSIYVIPKNYDYTPIRGGFPVRVLIETIGGSVIIFQALKILLTPMMKTTGVMFLQAWLCLAYFSICMMIYLSFGYSLTSFLQDLFDFRKTEKKYSIRKINRREK